MGFGFEIKGLRFVVPSKYQSLGQHGLSPCNNNPLRVPTLSLVVTVTVRGDTYATW